MADKILNVRIQLRHDIEANWIQVDPVLLAGEAAVTLDGENKGRFKIGDGTAKWSELDYTGGDSTILAKSVMFDSDMIFTEQFGKYTPTGGKVTIPSNNKSLYEVLIDAYSEDKNPTVTQPSMTLSSATAKAYEVGTNVAPAYSSTFNAGAYEYGPSPTGVNTTQYAASNNKTEEMLTGASGTFASYQVIDGSDYAITLTITYSDGAVPKTALGADYDAGKITGKSISKTSANISGYRNSFYGTTTDKTVATDSAVIRGLSQKSNKALANGSTFTVNIPVGAQRVIIAYPATLRTVTSIKDVNGLNADITSAFASSTVSVEGANAYSAIEYRVYTQDYAQPNDTANTYTVTI